MEVDGEWEKPGIGARTGLISGMWGCGGAWKYSPSKRYLEVIVNQSDAVINFLSKKLCGHQAFRKRPGIREVLLVRVPLVCEGESEES